MVQAVVEFCGAVGTPEGGYHWVDCEETGGEVLELPFQVGVQWSKELMETNRFDHFPQGVQIRLCIDYIVAFAYSDPKRIWSIAPRLKQFERDFNKNGTKVTRT